MSELQIHKVIDSDASFQALVAAAQTPQAGLFMVFAHEDYYPVGGFNDYLGVALSLDQARAMVAEKGITLGAYQIVNHKNMEVVEAKRIGWEN